MGVDASPPKHTFNKAADNTIARANSISSQRAGEYNDSWSLEQLNTPWLDNLMRDFPSTPVMHEREYKRLIVMASMIDIKISRLGGGWKDDTPLDLINYIAAYTDLRNKFNERFMIKTQAAHPEQHAASNQVPLYESTYEKTPHGDLKRSLHTTEIIAQRR